MGSTEEDIRNAMMLLIPDRKFARGIAAMLNQLRLCVSEEQWLIAIQAMEQKMSSAGELFGKALSVGDAPPYPV